MCQLGTNSTVTPNNLQLLCQLRSTSNCGIGTKQIIFFRASLSGCDSTHNRPHTALFEHFEQKKSGHTVRAVLMLRQAILVERRVYSSLEQLMRHFIDETVPISTADFADKRVYRRSLPQNSLPPTRNHWKRALIALMTMPTITG